MTSRDVRFSDELPARRGHLVRAGLATLVSGLLLIVILATRGPPGRAHEGFVGAGANWTVALSQTAGRYVAWFESLGLSAEAALLERLAGGVTAVALTVGAEQPAADLTFSQALIASSMFSLLRVSFVAVASLRPSLLLVILAFVWARVRLRPHRGTDLLGQTGNGRIFFSGIQVGLEPTDSNGAPATQVMGVACPERAPMRQVVRSEIASCLRNFGALNDTNLELLSVILAAETMPGYVAPSGEEVALAHTWSGGNLRVVTHAVLRAALRAHAECETDAPRVASDPRVMLTPENLEQHLHAVYSQVLTESARMELLTLPRAQVATAILAVQTGKVLLHAFEGGRWLRKSRFGQLSARAVLHALPSFASNYSFAERGVIRQAIVYGLRRSVAAPVKLPTRMPGPTHALRQWVECVLACPHELSAVADEVELFGLVREHEQKFRAALSEKFRTTGSRLRKWCFTTGATAFLPAPLLCSLARGALPNEQSLQVAMLVRRVAGRAPPEQEDAALPEDHPAPQQGAEANPHMLTPPTTIQIRTLTTEHGLSPDDALLWQSLRNVLASQSWLARRVGDYSVPDQAIIFGVFVNGESRHGSPAMVALRASRFEELLGPRWAQHFTPVGRATMAETRADYERRLKRDDPATPLDEEVASG